MPQRASGPKLISKFQYQSILAKTSVLLFLFTAFVIGSFYYLFSSMAIERYKEESRYHQHMVMTRTGNAMDTALFQAARVMEKQFADQSITGLLISPNRSDNLRLTNVMSALSGMVAGEPLMKQAYLYSFGSDVIYSSDGSIQSIMQSKDRKMIISCFSSRNISTLEVDGAHAGLMVKDSRLFLFFKYPNQLPMGALIVELDADELYRTAADPDSLGPYRLSVFEQNLLPLFGGQTPYPADTLGRPGAGFRSTEQADATIYTYVSEKTGFTFLSVTNTADIVPPFRSILQSASPFLAVFVVIIILFALYLIRANYKPIQDVIYSMVADGKRARRSTGNEVDFIRDTYRSSEETVERLSGLLSAVAPAVTERVFTTLLAGASSREDILTALQSIGSAFHPDAKYLALVMVQADASESLGDVEAEINMAWFSDLWYQYWEEKAPAYFLRMDGGLCAGILSFRADVANALVKRQVERFHETAASRSGEQRYRWLIGVGQLHVGIMELRKSYLEAREELNRLLYYRRERDSAESEPNDDLQTSLPYYTGRLRQLIGFALEGRAEDFHAGLSILHEAACQNPQPEALQRIYQSLYNVLAEEMIKYHIEPALSPNLREKDTAEMEAVIMAFCHSALEQLLSAGQRGNNKYTESARKYIADHYYLNSLSLEQVSRHVGISSPYLSKIFAESTGAGFLDYLNQYRIDKAKQLLSATDLTVSEIGYKVGFQSHQSFTRVFKRYMGQTPSGYREGNRMLQNRATT